MDKRSKVVLITTAFILFSIFVVGMVWLVNTPALVASALLAYVAGLSMIVLPCTLPLVFVIVPLALGKKPLKALLMAVLFGLGLSITLSVYGALVGLLGGYIGMNQFVRAMFGIAGVMALIFGAKELGLLRFDLPFFSSILPEPLQKSGDYTKSFGMGLLLGNAGVGCPNPLFYVLLTYIATIGKAESGIWLGLVHGLGRATPLIFLTILAILGINATKWITEKKDAIKQFSGWGLVGVGAFLFTFLPFGMAWWEESIFHGLWNSVIQSVFPRIAESTEIEELLNIQGGTGGVLPWALMGVIIGWVIIWNTLKQVKKGKNV